VSLSKQAAVIASEAWRSRRAAIERQTFERRPLDCRVASLLAMTIRPICGAL
jgi:hypothetical protein